MRLCILSSPSLDHLLVFAILVASPRKVPFKVLSLEGPFFDTLISVEDRS